MPDDPHAILILEQRIDSETLRRLVEGGFGDMVKFVADVRRGVIAIGGELHADAEQRLLDAGSRQEDLWGANYYPGRGQEGCVEFTSLINISPARGNRGMEITDPVLCERIRSLTHAMIGDGEGL
jgi:Protein of unknown function (DUF5674)